MNNVTRNDLDAFEQYALELLSRGETLLTPNRKPTYDRLLGMGLATLIPAVLTTFPYDGKELRITPAGRALLPTPDTTVNGCTRCHTNAAVVRGLCVDCAGAEIDLGVASVDAHAKTLERVTALEAENARLRDAMLEALAFARTRLIPDDYAPRFPNRREGWLEYMQNRAASILNQALNPDEYA